MHKSRVSFSPKMLFMSFLQCVAIKKIIYYIYIFISSDTQKCDWFWIIQSEDLIWFFFSYYFIIYIDGNWIDGYINGHYCSLLRCSRVYNKFMCSLCFQRKIYSIRKHIQFVFHYCRHIDVSIWWLNNIFWKWLKTYTRTYYMNNLDFSSIKRSSFSVSEWTIGCYAQNWLINFCAF